MENIFGHSGPDKYYRKLVSAGLLIFFPQNKRFSIIPNMLQFYI